MAPLSRSARTGPLTLVSKRAFGREERLVVSCAVTRVRGDVSGEGRDLKGAFPAYEAGKAPFAA